jgi:hypothetical protein
MRGVREGNDCADGRGECSPIEQEGQQGWMNWGLHLLRLRQKPMICCITRFSIIIAPIN